MDAIIALGIGVAVSGLIIGVFVLALEFHHPKPRT